MKKRTTKINIYTKTNNYEKRKGYSSTKSMQEENLEIPEENKY